MPEAALDVLRLAEREGPADDFCHGGRNGRNKEQDPLLGESERQAGIRQVLVTRNSLGGVYFGFQSFQIGDRHRAAVDLEHSFCL
jgi:hypothetical protein